MSWIYVGLAVFSLAAEVACVIIYVKDNDKGVIPSLITFAINTILCTVLFVTFFKMDAAEDASSAVIDLDNCRYVGAEVYTTDDDHTVFIDITSGDGALYAYNGQVDATAQYMLTLDAKTGEVLVVWQNVH